MRKKSEHEVHVMPWIAFTQADKHTVKADILGGHGHQGIGIIS